MYRITAKMVLISALCVLAMALAATSAFAQAGGRAEAAFKDIKVLQGTAADQLIPTMQFFEASLGVTCNHCHAADRVAKWRLIEIAGGQFLVVCKKTHAQRVEHRLGDNSCEVGVPECQRLCAGRGRQVQHGQHEQPLRGANRQVIVDNRPNDKRRRQLQHSRNSDEQRNQE